MDVTLSRAVADAHAALKQDASEGEREGHAAAALRNLLAAVEALHPDGRPQGTVYLLIGGGSAFDPTDIEYIDVYTVAPPLVDAHEAAYQATVGMPAVDCAAARIEGAKR